ncbi:MAG: polysaccharide deacetylase family protein [Anaerolineae bacterium]|nr:polysaccharide deacetylase family protein [Anaerolineae bacterium]
MGVKQWVKPAFGAALDRSGLARLLEALPWPVNGFVALTYHRLKPDPDLDDALLNVADLEAFDAQMAFLARRMRPISGDDLIAHLTGGRALPPRAVLVTFDDAYRDFLTDGWPIMKRHGVPATLFVPTAYPGGEIAGFWWDRLARALRRTPAGALDLPAGGAVRWGDDATRAHALERLRMVIETSHVAEAMALVDTWVRQLGDPPADGPPAGEPAMCTWAELRALAAEGVTLGAHTRSHAILAPPLRWRRPAPKSRSRATTWRNRPAPRHGCSAIPTASRGPSTTTPGGCCARRVSWARS